MTVFLRVLKALVDDKPAALLRSIAALREDDTGHAPHDTAFDRDPTKFSIIPGSPFAYWLSEAVRSVFDRFEGFEGDTRTVKQGLATADDFRFVRTSWEVDLKRDGEHWFA